MRSSRLFSRRSLWILASWAVDAAYCERACSSESERCATAPSPAPPEPVRRDRRVGKSRNCRHQGEADTRENIRRLPQPTNDKPLVRGRTGAPGGAGTSRRQEASRLFGRASTGTAEIVAKHTQFCASWCIPSRTWYGPAPCLGRHKRRVGAFPFAAIALVVLAAPALGLAGSSPVCLVAARAERAAGVPVARRPSSSCIRSTSDSSRPDARRRARPAGGLAARRAREPRAAAPDRPPRRPARAARGSQPGSACSTSRATSSRSRSLRREEPRRRDLEPRQPEPDDRPGRGRAEPARGRPQAALDRSGQHPRSGRRQSRLLPQRRARPRSRSRKPARRGLVPCVARDEAPAERQPDLGVRSRGAGGAGPDAGALSACRRAGAPGAGPAQTPRRPLAEGGRTITVTATGYSLPGSTATGLPVGWGVAAVDPAVIPLGTHMTSRATALPSRPTPVARSSARPSTLVPDDRPGERLGSSHVTIVLRSRALSLSSHDPGRPRLERPRDKPRSADPARAARGRPRSVPHGAPQPARRAGGPGRRRVRQRQRGVARPSGSSRPTSSSWTSTCRASAASRRRGRSR